jgi:UDP-arabinose 4-epimerase
MSSVREAHAPILVTGGAGYIGSHSCKALAAAGYLPITYDNLSTGNRHAVRWGPLERGDILDAARVHEVMREYRPVGVLHFAALALVGESMAYPGLYYRTNVGGALTLLDACRVHDVEAFVLSSTCATYGFPDRLPIAEGAALRPINPYGASKAMVERILDDYGMAYGLRHVALRYFNAAGADPEREIGEERDVETHLVPLALDAILGRRPPLMVLGDDYPTRDGTAIRDYIHVSDLAEAHVRALRLLLDGSASRKLNLGTGRGHSVREVIEVAEAVAGRPVPYRVGPRRPGDPPELVADPTVAHTLLGEDLTCRSSLRTIVETAWAWHLARPLPRSAQPTAAF